jgi:hypothetical protein
MNASLGVVCVYKESFRFSIDSHGTLSAEYRDPTYFYVTDIADSTNGNGSVSQYFGFNNGHIMYAATWHSDGSGMWTSYDASVQGKITGTGIWGK